MFSGSLLRRSVRVTASASASAATVRCRVPLLARSQPRAALSTASVGASSIRAIATRRSGGVLSAPLLAARNPTTAATATSMPARLTLAAFARFNSTAAGAAVTDAVSNTAAAAAAAAGTPATTTAAIAAGPFVDPAAAAAAAAAGHSAGGATVAAPAVVATVTDVSTAAAAAVPPAWYEMPLLWFQQGLELLHTSTGLPWWATIIVATVGMRAMILPLTVFQHKFAAQMSHMAPEQKRWSTEYYQLQVQGKLNEETNAHMKRQLSALQTKHGQKKGIAASLSGLFVTMPLFMGMFFALRDVKFFGAAMTTEGLGWFQNLALADPMYGLPVLSALTMAASVRWGSDLSTGTDPNKKKMVHVFTGMALISVFFTYSFPAAVCWYWLIANITSVATGFFMRRPAVKKFFNIPKPYVEPVLKGTVVQRAAYAAPKFADMPLPANDKSAKAEAERKTKLLKEAAATPVPIVQFTHRPKTPQQQQQSK